MGSRNTVLLWMVSACLLGTPVFASTFGRTQGQFGVSSTGSAQYSIPIWTPPGPRGIQPQIALSYNSESGVGPLGVGWSVGGLSAIARCNKSYAQDATPAPVTLTATDAFCINGNRLRLTSGTYGTDGSTYQNEIADFSNVTAHGSAGTGPAYFTVQGRDGLTYDYGYTDTNGNGVNSEVIATPLPTASAWLLSKVIDRSGNNLVVNYVTLTGTAVPDTILWTPTSAGASSYTYTMKFTYGPNVPQSSLMKNIGGTAVGDTELLSSIAISSSGTVIKDYFLGYEASPTTGREELITVTECADSTQSNCLTTPMTIGYQHGAAGVSSTPTPALSSTGALLTARYDLNGDGVPDLIYNPTGNGPWSVAFGSTTGYGTPINTGLTGTALFGNMTGGKEDGILVNKSGTWWYYTWNGSSFVGATANLTVDTASQGFQLADIDGDGLPDLIDLNVTYNPVTKKSTATVLTHLNNSTGSSGSFSNTVNTAYTLGGLAGAQLMTPDTQYGKLRRYDFNGDGRDDIVLSAISGSLPSYTLSTYELVSTGSTYTGTLIASSSADAYLPVYFTAWNEDACTDFITGSNLYISGCNGSVTSTIPISGTVLGTMDWDGDGRTDIIVADGSFLGVYFSTGSGISGELTSTVPYSATCQYVAIDANGDGLDDLGCWSSTGSQAFSYFPHNAPGQPPDLANLFKDAYGLAYTPSYVALSQASSSVYVKGTTQVFPQHDYDGPRYVLQSALMPDGIGGTYTQAYAYTAAVTNLQGRGFQGFTTVQSHDSRTGFYDKRIYSTGFLSSGLVVPTAGMLTAESVTQSDGTNVSVGQATLAVLTLDSTANGERYFPYIASSSVNKYEVQVGGSYNGELITTTATNNGTPDSYGNFTNVTQTVTDEDAGPPGTPGSPYVGQQWSTKVVKTIAPDHGSNWCLNLSTETDTTRTSPGSTIIRHVTYVAPDYANCRETEQVVESGNSTYQVDTRYGFDGFGNVNSQTVTGIGMTARVSGITYGTTGQFPVSQKNALSQQSQLSFDPNSGKQLSATDPNGIKTSWLYDPFQRKSKETRPDGTSTTWTYSSCASACVNTNNQMTIVQTAVNSDSSTLNIQNIYTDQFDRTLVTSKQMLNGAYDRNEVRYDALGNIQQSLAPCTFVGCTTYWTVNTYDTLNRLTRSQRPISATNSTIQMTNIAYTGRTTTTTDPQAKVTTTITKVTGRLGRTKDHNGYYVNINDDAFGSVLSVTDSLSNTLRTMTYDYGIGAFQRTLSNDVDLGSRAWTYDALGEVTASSDGKGQSFSTTYDVLSRPKVRTEPDLTTTWTWGTTAGSYNIGRLAGVSSTASAGTYSETYTYSTSGQLTNQKYTIPGYTTIAFDYGYSSVTGLMQTLIYPQEQSPANFRVTAGYRYQYGILQEILDDADGKTVWWVANATNPRGQITKETTEGLVGESQIVSNRTYDAVTGWLGTNQTGVGSGAALQNESYLYDQMGNVTQRQNNNLGLTEDVFYDNLYRLDHSTLGGSTNLQMSYDAMGDITSRTDVAGGAAWTYDPTHIHRVTQAGSTSYSYTYDANGNASTRNGSTLGWTSYNYPSSVATSAESATFDYGPGRQRWRMAYNGSAGVETTYYVGPMFEAVFTSTGTDFRHYIYAGNKPVVVVSRTSSGTVTVHSLLLDNQGSIATVVADATGTSTANESFTAYGNRREANTWSGTPTTAELNAMNGITRQGYTFQTVLGAMGLNHMNGRIEDSITGRFLSADPTIPDPSSTQSYNRYSYVNNNPMTMIDPTGFKPKNNCHWSCPSEFVFFASPAGSGNWGAGATGDVDDFVFGSDDTTALTNLINAYASAINNAINAAWDASDSSGGSGSAESASATNGGSSPAAAPAQSQASGDQLQEITVTAQSTAQAPPALFGAGLTYFFAPSGFQFQAIRQAGQNFAAQGGKLSQIGPLLGRGGKYNLQVDSYLQYGVYDFYQDVANFDVGVFLNGYFNGSSLGYAEMIAVGEAYGAGLVNGTSSSNWSASQTVQWAQWWNAGWNAAQTGNYPVQVSSPLQLPAPTN